VAWAVVWPPWPTSVSTPSRISSPQKPKTQDGIRDRLRRLCRAENTQREKLSGRQKSAGEIPSRRGKIVAIIIAIELGFIGTIIFITSTFIIFITTPSRCNILD
jgi:hypothetical protein